MADTFSDAPVDLPTDGDPIPSLPDKILTHILSLIALVNADRISSLPDKILIHILSFLPTTKTRIQTSVLSKRWRHLWISVPSIDLSFPLLSPAVTIEDDYQYHCIVDRILHHYPHPTLNRLSVDHQSASHYTYITPSDEDLDVRELQLDSLDSTIRFAASKSVQEIQLRFHSFPDTCDNPRIPQSLLLCSETLISLKLTSLCFPKLSIDFQGFPFLKTLHLNFVLFTNSDALAQLFSSYCPSLESLILDKSRWVPNVSITPPIFPNLLSFKFVNFMDRSPQNLCCETPNLRYFHFSGALECLYLKNCPRLHSAHIHSSGTGLPSCRKMIEIAHTFANVQVLVVGYWFFPHFHHSLPKQKKKLQLCKDYPICHGYNFNLPVFENLKEFHCHGILLHKLTMRALLVFVCKCPSLEKLCINLDFYKSGLPEFILSEERNASSSTKNDILEDYDDQLCNFKGVEEVYPRIVEEKQLLCCRQDLQLRLKTITVMQFAGDSIYMRMLRFIFEKSPGLELLQLKVVQQQPRVDLAQLEEQIRCFPGVAPSVKMELSETEVSEYDSYCRGKCSPLEHLWG